MTYFLYLNKVCLRVTTRLHCRSLQLQIWFDSKRGNVAKEKTTLCVEWFCILVWVMYFCRSLINSLMIITHNRKLTLKDRIDRTEI